MAKKIPPTRGILLLLLVKLGGFDKIGIMKEPKNFLHLMKKYGPGFVAFSKKNGRVLAYGKDIKKLWETAEKKRVDFSKIVISHIPKYGTVNSLSIREQI